MQKRFQQHLQTHFPGIYDKKLLIAVSGGMDSVVLAHLCQKEGLDFAIAHCNFQLRGEASDQDEDFVRELAGEMKVNFHFKRFETKKQVAEGQSIQLVARELRYHWFNVLLEQEKYDALLTAHHLNDDVETFFINLLRGTGLRGLAGIPQMTTTVLRLLLPFSVLEIERFAEKNKIKWREDRSNASDDYLRNRIRHHLIPFLTGENPHFLDNFLLTRRNLEESVQLLTDYTGQLKKSIMKKRGNEIHLNLQKIKENPHPQALLYEILNPYGFTAWENVYDLLEAQVGKQVFASQFRLVKDRGSLILTERNQLENQEISVDGVGEFPFPEGRLICEKVIKVTNPQKDKAYLATERLVYPLKLRLWQPGDRFQPLGMKGRKKLSDFLKDEKLSLPQKEKTWVLLSEGNIVWVVGQRIDHRYRVREETKEILKIDWIR